MKLISIIFMITSCTLGLSAELDGLNLNQINNLIGSLDQSEIMDGFKAEIVHDRKAQSLTKFEGGRTGTATGMRCKSGRLDLSDAQCEVIHHNAWGNLPESYLREHGEYTLGANAYKAICAVVPGEWKKESYKKYSKPRYQGLKCYQHKYSGH